MPRPVPEAAVEAAVEGISANYSPSWAKDWRASIEKDARAAVEAAMPVIVREVIDVVRDTPSTWAHHGGEGTALYIEETFLDD